MEKIKTVNCGLEKKGIIWFVPLLHFVESFSLLFMLDLLIQNDTMDYKVEAHSDELVYWCRHVYDHVFLLHLTWKSRVCLLLFNLFVLLCIFLAWGSYLLLLKAGVVLIYQIGGRRGSVELFSIFCLKYQALMTCSCDRCSQTSNAFSCLQYK